VGREVVGAELEAIKQPLNALVEAMFPAHDSNRMTARKREDAMTRLEELYTKLSTGGCGDQTIMQIGQLSQAVAQQDYASANRLHLELSKGDWNTHKNWLQGVKRILPR
jgi:hypothetical protein